MFRQALLNLGFLGLIDIPTATFAFLNLPMASVFAPYYPPNPPRPPGWKPPSADKSQDEPGSDSERPAGPESHVTVEGSQAASQTLPQNAGAMESQTTFVADGASGKSDPVPVLRQVPRNALGRGIDSALPN